MWSDLMYSFLYFSISASTGKEAVEATLKYKPDIVLMDISMPEMDAAC